jgi:ATP-dependent Lhr-like helicase
MSDLHPETIDMAGPLPEQFGAWFASRGWTPRPHQLELLEAAQAGQSTLLIAPTGAGKTLAGFLPSLVDLAERCPPKPGQPIFGPHTLYISPLKALAVDIARNLEAPVSEMDLAVRLETRTGDTPAHKRQRQKYNPPDMLLTTPEQVALLIAARDAERFFRGLRYVIFDELHSLVTSKRGELLALGLARLRKLAPKLQTIGLSATVAEPDDLRAWLVPQKTESKRQLGHFIRIADGAKPELEILESDTRVPWAGHTARYAFPDVYQRIKAHRTTLIFVNTRWQAEMTFSELWRINDDSLPIALHHGSLDRGQRRKVETAMAEGQLRAVVATSTLDLGIDWGAPTTGSTSPRTACWCRRTGSRCWNARRRSTPII